jgi:hypothetical protein
MVLVVAPYDGTRLTATRWVVADAYTGKPLTEPMTREAALAHEAALRAEQLVPPNKKHGRAL